jgi:signal transduction histidine kinase
MAGFPVQRGHDLLGVLVVIVRRPLTTNQLQLLKVLAAQAAVAIQNARLHEEVQHHAAALEQANAENAHLVTAQQATKEMAKSLQEVALVLNSGLEMRPLLIRILQQLRRVIPYDSAGIFLREGNDLVHYGSSIQGVAEEGNYARQPYDDPTYFPLYTRRPHVVADVYQETDWHMAWQEEFVPRIRSWMAVPLLEEEDVIGVITADSFSVSTYDDESVKLVQTFANQAVSAIRNARLYKEARQAKETAEAANRAKSRFLATLSHELRTPLSGVLGYAQLLQRDSQLTNDQRRQVATIEQSGNHLLTLINDLLDLAKIEAGRFELSLSYFELSTFLQAIGEMIRLQVEQKGLNFELATEYLPTAVIGDEKRLRQVLINLLGNAVKFTHQGQITLRVTQLASSHTVDSQVWLRFIVADTGIGIDANHLHQIFEPFQQVGSNRQQTEGAGLGLAISRSLIDLMGGQLEVSSEVGLGSTFFFTIPLQPAQNSAGLTAVNQSTTSNDGRPHPFPAAAVPPPDELAILYAQTLQGDIAAIRQTAAHIAQKHTQYHPFTQEVERLAQTFQLNELKKLVAACLENEQ